VRVVDLSEGVAGAYGTRLLAAWGADVVKVERPGGDPVRWLGPRLGESPDGSLLFAHVNAGKRGAVLDARTEPGCRAILGLVERADLVVESAAPGWWRERGVDFAKLCEERPELVVCSVTPFGQDGPRAQWRTTALTAAASGGQMLLCGDEDRPPLKTAGFQAEYQAGLHVFAASITALLAAKRTGIGDHLDLSIQEVQAACLEAAGPIAMVRGSDSTRTGNQLRAVWGLYATADGHIGVSAMARQTASVYRCIGHPELAEDASFGNLLLNPEMNSLVEALMSEWCGARTSAEIFAEAAKERAPFSLVATPEDLLASRALAEAGFWREVQHPVVGRHRLTGVPFDIDGYGGEVRRAPLLGEHTAEVLAELEGQGEPGGSSRGASQTAGLLEGIRVLDLTQVWAGPYATRFLADMGADVIHIEGPAFPDAVRGIGRAGDERGFDKSTYFNEYNRNKRGLVLDLHDGRGMEAFRRLVAKADVVIENWSVGVAERLGIGYDELRALNPRIVFAQMPPFGKTGPEANRVGFGPSIEQMGGLVALQGYEGGPPHRSGISYGDPNAGVVAAGAVALALYKRELTGQGSHVVLRQRDNITGMVGEFMLAAQLGAEAPVRIGNRDPGMAPHGVFRCRDDSGRMQADAAGNPLRELTETWVAIAVEDDAGWAALVSVVDDEALRDRGLATARGRLAAQEELDTALERWTRRRDAEDVAAQLQAVGVSAMPVLSPLMLVRDAHLAARRAYGTYDHPEAGVCGTMAPVWRLARRPAATMRPAPCFGQHNAEVLVGLAGLSPGEVKDLEDAGVVADVPK
jgi:crotonobetainyl-CoA:carnitine CoA-transferase CaiB-like acyl-CoA transferase